jgi:hypothetical protein
MIIERKSASLRSEAYIGEKAELVLLMLTRVLLHPLPAPVNLNRSHKAATVSPRVTNIG